MIFGLIHAVACTPAGSKYNLVAANSFLPVKFSKGAGVDVTRRYVVHSQRNPEYNVNSASVCYRCVSILMWCGLNMLRLL